MVVSDDLEFITRREYEFIMESAISSSLRSARNYSVQLAGARDLEVKGFRVSYYRVGDSVGYKYFNKHWGFVVSGR